MSPTFYSRGNVLLSELPLFEWRSRQIYIPESQTGTLFAHDCSREQSCGLGKHQLLGPDVSDANSIRQRVLYRVLRTMDSNEDTSSIEVPNQVPRLFCRSCAHFLRSFVH